MQDLIMAAYLFYFLVQGGGQLQMCGGQLQMYGDPQSRPAYLDTYVDLQTNFRLDVVEIRWGRDQFVV